jgi:hypothetical protein
MTCYGYVYESIDKRNGMFYVGQSTGEFNPDYHGSGLIIQKIINKYGKDNFTTRLIDYAETLNTLNKKEIAYIFAYRMVYGRKGLYNITGGGEFGDTYTNNPNKEKIIEKHKQYVPTIKTRNKIRKSLTGRIRSEEYKKKLQKPKSEEHKKHMRKPKSEDHKINIRNGLIGNRNGMFGRKWICNIKLQSTKTTPSDELSNYLGQGWKLGRLKFK